MMQKILKSIGHYFLAYHNNLLPGISDTLAAIIYMCAAITMIACFKLVYPVAASTIDAAWLSVKAWLIVLLSLFFPGYLLHIIWVFLPQLAIGLLLYVPYIIVSATIVLLVLNTERYQQHISDLDKKYRKLRDQSKLVEQGKKEFEELIEQLKKYE